MRLNRADEDYLKAILILHRKNGVVRSLDVAETLHVSKPSVSRAMKLLRENGFLTMDKDKLICLTDAGREMAEQVYEKHSGLEKCLISMGVNPDIAERDACGMEHVINPETLEQMKNFISNGTEECNCIAD